MVSSLGEPITIQVNLQKSVDGNSIDEIFIKARPSTLASRIKAAISQARFSGAPVFLHADGHLVQDNEMVGSFKDCNLYAGLDGW